MDIKIIISTHKKYWMPSDNIYLPIHAGADNSDIVLPYSGDNIGDNISQKNKNYCELTCIYWAWKNLDADYYGFVHYRRYFSKKKVFANKRDKILNRKDIEELIIKCHVILPKQRSYWIETNYSQYIHAHHKADLDVTREIIKENFSEYLVSFDECMKRTKGHRFNMFIMDKTHFYSYCEWLFSILFELENRLDISDYSYYDARVFGFVSERLLDVFITYNRIEYLDIPFIFLENQNWIKKIFLFLKRKILHRGKK